MEIYIQNLYLETFRVIGPTSILNICSVIAVFVLNKKTEFVSFIIDEGRTVLVMFRFL